MNPIEEYYEREVQDFLIDEEIAEIRTAISEISIHQRKY